MRHSYGVRGLVTSSDHPPHQSAGIQGGVTVPSAFPEPVGRAGSPHSDRQYHSGCLLKSPGWHPLYSAQCPSHTVLELVPWQCHCPHCRIPTRPGQFGCGFPVAGQDSSVRMDTAPTGHGESTPTFGPPSRGPIRVEPQSSAPSILFESQGPCRLEGGRVLLQLGEDQGLRVPAYSLDSASPQQDSAGPSDCHPDSPVVAQEDLVSRSHQPSDGLPQEPSDPTGSSSPAVVEGTSSGP